MASASLLWISVVYQAKLALDLKQYSIDGILNSRDRRVVMTTWTYYILNYSSKSTHSACLAQHIYICIIVQLGHVVNVLHLHVRGQLCAWAESTCMCILGKVNWRGYGGQLKYTICDACRPCHSILSILKPVFRQLQQICTYESLRCLDLKIWQFFCGRQRHNRLLYP